MTLMSRRRALAATLGFGAAALTGTQVSATPLIVLPNDIVAADAATITAITTPSTVVAMTFDDGPHPTHTPRLLDMMREHDIHRGTVDAMPQTLNGLAARGLRFATVSQLAGWPLWQSRTFRRVVQTG